MDEPDDFEEEVDSEDASVSGSLEDFLVLTEDAAWRSSTHRDVIAEQFDIHLPAEHSYLAPGLVAVQGRSVLEADWCGRMPCVGHHSVLYPGETVPMVKTHPRDCDIFQAAIQSDRLFGLIFAEVTDDGNFVSGYGILCEVYEATEPARLQSSSLAFKARARQRFKFRKIPKRQSIVEFNRVQMVEIVILPEVTMGDPFKNSRVLSLNHMRSSTSKAKLAKIKRMDAIVTNYPLFVLDFCDIVRLSTEIRNYFNKLKCDSLPDDPVSLSFWVASNLPLAYNERLNLFKEDNALQRLIMEVKFIEAYYELCCQNCGDATKTLIAQREDIFAMSSEGIKSNYCNLGGYVHDIMTVSRIYNVRTSGPPSAEYSWFPGYMWTIIVCERCSSHIGWKFTSTRPAYRRQMFYAICKNYVYPTASAAPKAEG